MSVTYRASSFGLDFLPYRPGVDMTTNLTWTRSTGQLLTLLKCRRSSRMNSSPFGIGECCIFAWNLLLQPVLGKSLARAAPTMTILTTPTSQWTVLLRKHLACLAVSGRNSLAATHLHLHDPPLTTFVAYFDTHVLRRSFVPIIY